MSSRDLATVEPTQMMSCFLVRMIKRAPENLEHIKVAWKLYAGATFWGKNSVWKKLPLNFDRTRDQTTPPDLHTAEQRCFVAFTARPGGWVIRKEWAAQMAIEIGDRVISHRVQTDRRLHQAIHRGAKDAKVQGAGLGSDLLNLWILVALEGWSRVSDLKLIQDSPFSLLGAEAVNGGVFEFAAVSALDNNFNTTIAKLRRFISSLILRLSLIVTAPAAK